MHNSFIYIIFVEKSMILYKIENKINNKVYIGITKCSILKRWSEHKCKSKNSKKHLYASMRKHGIDNFEITLIKKFDDENEMYKSEIDYIQIYNSNNPIYGYNNSIGGEISSLGKKLSMETKNKISKYQKDRIRTPHSLETKNKMKIAALSNKSYINLIKSYGHNKGKEAKNKSKIYSINKFGIECKYDSITDAFNQTNISITSICNNLKKRTKTAGGLTWHYQQEN